MSLPASSSLAENPEQVNPSLNRPAESPSLVYSRDSNAFNSPWSREQKRRYGQLLSWCREAQGRGCQLLRVDLTSAKVGDSELLGRHFQELRRRAERKFHYTIEYYRIETREGFGVYHLIWAIKCERPVYIPQSWLSATWKEIHGAHRVWIKRMGGGKKDQNKVAKYLVSQYLAGQKAHVRIAWSWWRSKIALCKAWKSFRRLTGDCDIAKPWGGLNWRVRLLSRQAKLMAWESLLTLGWCNLGSMRLCVRNRDIVLVSYSKL